LEKLGDFLVLRGSLIIASILVHDLVGSDSVRKSLTDSDIDWAETFKIRRQKRGSFANAEINELANTRIRGFFRPFPENTEGN
jgi:hypothetical protein